MAEPTRHDGAAIEVRGLTKSYGDLQAVRGIDLAVAHGQIFALLGPNGAGKTTTVEILEGYRSRDGGTAKVLGYDPGRQRQRLKSQIGIVLQSSGVDRYLTVSETVAMYAGFYPHPRPVDEVILSGVFIPLGANAPAWIVWIAKIFPVWHFAQGMQAGFLGTAFHWTDVLVVAIWGLAGLLLSVRFFSWEPRT